MADIKWTIDAEDIEWNMDWKNYGQPDRADEMVFEEAPALAALLINEVVFLNSHWYKFSQIGGAKPDGKGFEIVARPDARWTKEESELISVSVNCNDVFAWACSDAESLPYSEIENLYRMWRKDPAWGPAVWCMIQRRQLPQKPAEDSIRKAGIWDLDALKLGENTQDSEVAALFASLRSKTAQPTPAVIE